MKISFFSLALAAGFIQTAAGDNLNCESRCAACWKIGQPGVDIKLLCNSQGSCESIFCPAGYESMHCAKRERCICQKDHCGLLGPCQCGVFTSADGEWKNCKSSIPGGGCANT